MDKTDGANGGWESDEDTSKYDSHPQQNEILVQTHCTEADIEGVKKDRLNNKKSAFKQHFVEESTLRNIALDELEELSDAGRPSGADGNAGRASSSNSSDQAALQYALFIGFDVNYLFKPEGLLRLGLLACSTLSLGCISSAGTENVDVLNLPISSYIRAHIFATVFTILATTFLLVISVTTLLESFPIHWNITDAAINASLSTLLIFSSSMLIHAEQEYYGFQPPIPDWSKLQLALSAVFGYLSTLFCVFLTVLRSCARPALTTTEEIILTSLRAR